MKNPDIFKMLSDTVKVDDRESFTVSELCDSHKNHPTYQTMMRFAQDKVKNGEWLQTTKRVANGNYAKSFKPIK